MHNGSFQAPPSPSGNSGNIPQAPLASSFAVGNPGKVPPLKLFNPAVSTSSKSALPETSVLKSPSAQPAQAKPILIIDFEGLFYMGREAFKVEEIGKELHILLKFVKLIFLTQNIVAAKKLLSDKNVYHPYYNDPTKCEFVFRLNSFEKKQYVINTHLQHYLSENESTLSNKNQLMLVVFHDFKEELPPVDESICRLILINKTIRSMRSL